MRAAPCLLLAAAAAVGCASGDLSPRVVELEVEVAQLHRELDDVRAQAAAAHAGQVSRELNQAPADAPARFAALEAQVEDLRTRLAAAEAELKVHPPATAPSGEPHASSTRIPTPGGGPLPPPDEPLEVLAAGSGALLLVQTPDGLERVELVGVAAPRQVDAYRASAELRADEELRYGRRLTDDAAWEASRQHLAGLVAGRPVRLTYPPGPHRTPAGSARAYAEFDGGDGDAGPTDLGRAMIAAGFALAGPDEHPRRAAYRSAEAEAHAAGRGLHGETGSD